MDVNRLVEAIFNAPVTHLALGIGIVLSISLLGVIIMGFRAMQAVQSSNTRWEAISERLIKITDSLTALFGKFDGILATFSVAVTANTTALDSQRVIFQALRNQINDLKLSLDEETLSNERVLGKIEAMQSVLAIHTMAEKDGGHEQPIQPLYRP